MTTHYKDPLGCTYAIKTTHKGSRLRASDPLGKRFHDKLYKTERGAKGALTRISDSTAKQTGDES